MNVAASMSVSIVVDGALWGLMTFHHRRPKLVPYELREMCKHLGELLSQQVKAREDAEAHRQMLYLVARREKLSAILSKASSIGQALLDHLPELGGALPADGAAVVVGDKIGATDGAPSQAQIRELVAWLLDGAQPDVFETSSLVHQYAPAAGYARKASGLIAAIVSRAEPLVLLWFRAEQLETINWAGNPHKPAEPGAVIGTLTPRQSFEIWKETAHNQSKPWSAVEEDAALALKRSVLELLQTQKLREVNAQLRGALSEKETLLRQKDLLMQEVNHRVQNSLQLVNAMLALQAHEAGDDGLRAQFDLASDRIMAIAMVHRRLWQADHIQSVDFTSYTQELRDGLIETWGPEWRGQVTVHGQPILVPTDIAVVLALVIVELLMNGVKYAYAGRPGPIEVRIEQAPRGLHVVVKDQGVGMAAGHSEQGLGSRLTRGLIDQLDGELKVDSSAQGTSIVLSVPLAGASPGEKQ
jgi:light-regulated signal transduction histidine kinase (bacteriophytochrome)